MTEGEAARPVTAFLGLGSNLGDRAALLRAALAELDASDGVTVTAASPIYETPPWGPVPQGPYLNACLAVETTLSPRALLDHALAIEKRHGRERTLRWGPRRIDIDLLLHGQGSVHETGLVLPHPHMTQRAFVLVPLAEIAAGMIVDGRTVADWLAGLDSSEIRPRLDLGPLLG